MGCIRWDDSRDFDLVASCCLSNLSEPTQGHHQSTTLRNQQNTSPNRVEFNQTHAMFFFCFGGAALTTKTGPRWVCPNKREHGDFMVVYPDISIQSIHLSIHLSLSFFRSLWSQNLWLIRAVRERCSLRKSVKVLFFGLDLLKEIIWNYCFNQKNRPTVGLSFSRAF